MCIGANELTTSYSIRSDVILFKLNSTLLSLRPAVIICTSLFFFAFPLRSHLHCIKYRSQHQTSCSAAEHCPHVELQVSLLEHTFPIALLCLPCRSEKRGFFFYVYPCLPRPDLDYFLLLGGGEKRKGKKPKKEKEIQPLARSCNSPPGPPFPYPYSL
jgi:hypothetical protein